MDREVSDGFSVVATVLASVAALFGVIAIAIAWRNDGASGVEAATEQNVEMSDFKISPVDAELPAGPIELHVKNNGPTDHNLKIDGVGDTGLVKPGKSTELSLGTLEPGTYTWYCSVAGHKEAGMTGTFTVSANASVPAATAAADWQSIDTAHKKVVDEFLAGPPAKTAGIGGLPLGPKIESGVKVFDLTADVVQWEVSPGKTYEAWAYNGVVPGPEIRAKQGETVKVRLKNNLPQSTSIHFHGLEVADNKQDGVTFVTQDPIKPGETYTYTLTPINCGSHMYHSHHAADAQVPLGLLAAFIVDCTTTSTPTFAAHDSEYTQILSDGPLGFGINGKGFPATTPIVAKRNEKTLIRFMNEGLIIHPMHLHGHRMTVVAKDGNFLPAPYEADALNVAPGERYDVIVISLYAGAWAFHCHILTHAESPEGLHGMTTVWLVQP